MPRDVVFHLMSRRVSGLRGSVQGSRCLDAFLQDCCKVFIGIYWWDDLRGPDISTLRTSEAFSQGSGHAEPLNDESSHIKPLWTIAPYIKPDKTSWDP